MNEIKVKLDILEFKEDSIFYVYCPALNLTGYGKTEISSRESFYIVMDNYMEYVTSHNTFLEDIKILNWKSSGNSYIIQSLSNLSDINLYLKNILDNFKFKKYNINIMLPDVTKELYVKPIIYGILDNPSTHGVQAYAIDGQTGEMITSHYCSSENFAKSDLGFNTPLFDKCAFSDDTHSTVHFNKSVVEKYQVLYPNGYELQWIGFWKNNTIIEELLKLSGKKF